MGCVNKRGVFRCAFGGWICFSVGLLHVGLLDEGRENGGVGGWAAL